MFIATSLAYVATRVWITPEVERSRLAEKAHSAILAAMLDEQDELHAYLLTRSAALLEGSRHAKARVDRGDEDLAAATASVAELAGMMLRTRMAEERWQERWARLAAETPPDGIGPSVAEGRELFAAYRSEQAVFAHAIEHRTDILYRREWRATAGRVALSFSAYLAVLLFALGRHRALWEAIASPVARLLRDIGRIRDGEFPEVIVDVTGPRELRQLAQGLNEMVRAQVVARGIAESRDELEQGHSSQLRQVLHASREFSESLNLRYVVGAVRASAAALGGYERVIVWLMDDEQKRLLNADEHEAAAPSNATVYVGNWLAERAVKSGRTTLEPPEGQVRSIDGDKGPVRAIAIPLIVGARVVGALEARHAKPQRTTNQSIEILEMFALQAATAIESARVHQITETRSQVDALTRLFNRRRLEEDLDAECKRCQRYGRPLAFVMLDVDHFKAFNDSHGHPQADVALRVVAEVIAGGVRATDSAYRYGGEEFSVLLRETRAEDAMHFAERLRQGIEQRFATGTLAGITASFGVAQFAADVQTPGALVEAADAALYASKHAGRNRVALSSPVPPDPGTLRDDGHEAPQLVLAQAARA